MSEDVISTISITFLDGASSKLITSSLLAIVDCVGARSETENNSPMINRQNNTVTPTIIHVCFVRANLLGCGGGSGKSVVRGESFLLMRCFRSLLCGRNIY